MVMLQFIADYKWVLATLGTNLGISILYLVMMSRESARKAFAKFPLFLRKIIELIYLVPLFVSPLQVQPAFPFVLSGSFVFGFLLIISGGLIFLFSFVRVGDEDNLEPPQPVRLPDFSVPVSHSLYAGTLLFSLGITLWEEAFLNLIYLPVTFIMYYLLLCIEEQGYSIEAGDRGRGEENGCLEEHIIQGVH